MLFVLILLILFIVMDVKDFQNKQSMGESHQLITAAAVILRIAYAEVASTNALVGKEVFSDSQCQKLESTFKTMLALMGKSAFAYRQKCLEYEKGESN